MTHAAILHRQFRPRRALAALSIGMLLPILSAPAVLRAETSTPTTAPSAAISPILREAQRILASAKSSHYAHRTRVDESAGSYDVDCSGLVCYILQRISPPHLRAIPHGKRPRPLAIDFYNAFAAAAPAASDPSEATTATTRPAPESSAPTTRPTTAPSRTRGWQRVDRLIDARPGDVLAWRRITIRPGESTGHVVVIEREPTYDGEGIVRVPIIDSTGGGHGSDTRPPGQTGVGRGIMWFKVDTDGRPTAFAWGARNGRFVRVPIAIGRVGRGEIQDWGLRTGD